MHDFQRIEARGRSKRVMARVPGLTRVRIKDPAASVDFRQECMQAHPGFSQLLSQDEARRQPMASKYGQLYREWDEANVVYAASRMT